MTENYFCFFCPCFRNAAACFFALLMISLSAFADETKGLVTVSRGEASLFKNPSDKPQGGGPHVLFNGKTYNVIPAKIGINIQDGAVISTGGNGAVRIVYGNGDQLNVGPSTILVISRKEVPKKQPAVDIQLIIGKVRAVAAKSGSTGADTTESEEAREFQVRTSTVLTGVRGTDYSVHYDPVADITSVFVMRGVVDVSLNGENSGQLLRSGEAIEVQGSHTGEGGKNNAATPSDKGAGNTSAAKGTKKLAASKRPMSREQLTDLKKYSILVPDKSKEKSLDGPTAKTIHDFEKTATEVTLKEIKTESPKLFEKLKSAGGKSAAELSSEVLDDLLLTAMSGQDESKGKGPRKKPDLKDIDEDVYKKYYKLEQ